MVAKILPMIVLLKETEERRNHRRKTTMDGNGDDDDNYKAIANNNDSYFVNLCDDNDNYNEEESWEQKQLKRAIEESIREASASVSTAVSSQLRTTAATASSSSTVSTTTASTATATLSSTLSLTEDEQLILAQTIQLSQIEQHEKERKESMMMDCAIQESHKSHYVDTQNYLSMEIAKDLHTQIIEPEDIAYAIHESFQSNEKRKLQTQLNHQYTNYKIARSEDKQIGCWDCPQCTYVQLQPYRSHCFECKMVAPSHQICFTPIPTNIKFGLEIEIIVTNGKKDGMSFQSIADNLTMLGSSDNTLKPVIYMGYTHQTTPDYWKIVPDSSVVGDNHNDDDVCDNDLCFELVSPPVIGENGLHQLRSIMNNVRQLGIATNASCGFHVHIDAEEDSTTILSNLINIKRISQCFVSLENAFDVLVVKQQSPSPSQQQNHHQQQDQQQQQQQHHTSNRRTNRNKYCKSNRLEFGHLSNRQRWYHISEATSKEHVVQMLNGRRKSPSRNNVHDFASTTTTTSTIDNKYNKNNLDRNRKLNLTNITNPKRPSTYEFRHYGGVEDIFDAECWVRLILLFCYNTATATATGSSNDGRQQEKQQQQQNYNNCLLHESADAKDELRALFDIVNCPGLEQVFTIDRKLFLPSQQITNGYWSCLTCEKQFDSSRSLSQHCFALGHTSNSREEDDNNNVDNNNNSSRFGSGSGNKNNNYNKKQYSTKTQQVKNYIWSCLTCGKEFDSSRSLSRHCRALRHKYHNSNNRDSNNNNNSSSTRDNNTEKYSAIVDAATSNVTNNDSKIDNTKSTLTKKLPVAILGVVFLSSTTMIMMMTGHRDHSQAQAHTHVISTVKFDLPQNDFISFPSDTGNMVLLSVATAKVLKVSIAEEDARPTNVIDKIQKKAEWSRTTSDGDHQNRHITHQSIVDDSATTTMGLEQHQQQRMVVGVNAPLDWIPMTVLQHVADIVNLYYLESALWIVVLLLLAFNIYMSGSGGGGDHTDATTLRHYVNGNDRNKRRAGRKRQRVGEVDDFDEKLLSESLTRSTPSLPRLAPTTPHRNVDGVTIDNAKNIIYVSPSEKRQQQHQQQHPVPSRSSANFSSSSTNNNTHPLIISKRQAQYNAMKFAKRDKQQLEESRGTINTGSNNSRDTTYDMPTPSSSTNNQTSTISKQEARANALKFAKRDKQRLEEARGTIHIGSNNSRNSHDIAKTMSTLSSSINIKAQTTSIQQARANALEFAKRDKKRLDDAKK
ncbi:hypothetical protein FRACYDRAFT_246081 [Fragilariopsis cylindrus CCMP1102]|uniref:C2H2-type domain-containing protein n=1 Tax=Fragilariopsis cylindrus CCMP1102 TaxID=635003 RepID=A0A1E7EYS9_9STRA|nr:hypothetical protein FRACYDRAFT_246081 [Fragilariopsis cylindrus CCMP1102]|eukprot:OEU10979.1 hypothetical protein FRACYDRAFT_246081 [Fragilariopsis cylindrus CCMP1102]